MQESISTFIGYIIPKPCQTHTVIVESEDNFHELDASGYFLNVPIQVGTTDFYQNKFKLSVRWLTQKDEFQAIPFCLWQNKPDYRQSLIGKIIWMDYSISDTNIFTKNGLSWLGSTSSVEVDISLKRKHNNVPDESVSESQHDQLLINESTFVDWVRCLRSDFHFQPNSWFVAVKRPSYWPSQSNNPQHLNYRIVKNLKVFIESRDMRYNFVETDNRTYPLDQVLFYKKIQTIWDWLYCFKLLRHYRYANYL